MLLFLIFFALIFGFTPYCSIFASPTELQSKETSKLIGVKSPELEATKLGSHVRSCRPRDVEVFSTHNCLFPDRIETIHESQVRSNPSDHYENRTIHYGDIIVEGDETFLIKDCEFIQTGNIIVKDNATFIIQNATLIMNQTWQNEYEIRIQNDAKFRANRATLTSFEYTYGVSGWDSSEINITNSLIFPSLDSHSSLYITNSMLQGAGYDYNSVGYIVNSTIKKYLTCNSASSVYIVNTTVKGGVSSYGSSLVFIINSTITSVSAWHTSSLSVSRSAIQYFMSRDDASVFITNSSINWVKAGGKYGTHSYSFFIINSTIGIDLWFAESSNATLTLNPGYVKYWNIFVNETVQGIDWDITTIDTEIVKWRIYCWESASISIQNSTINQVSSLESSVVEIANSTVSLLEYEISCYGDVTIINNLPQGNFSTNVTVVNSIIHNRILFVKSYGLSSIFIRDSTVNTISTRDSSSISILNSTVEGVMWIYDSSTVVISNTMLMDRVLAFDSSSVSISKSVLGRGASFSGSSLASVTNSTTEWVIDCRDFASVVIENSTVSIRLSFIDESDGIITLRPGYREYWNIFVNETVSNINWNITTVNTNVTSWWIQGRDYSSLSIANSILKHLDSLEHSCISISNSTIENAYLSGSSTIKLVNTEVLDTLIIQEDSTAYIWWFLMVTVKFNNNFVRDIKVKVYYAHNETLAVEGITDSNGKVRFTLLEKIVKATETLYIGNYVVKSVSDEKFLTLDTNKEVTITLQRLPVLKVHFVDGDNKSLGNLVVKLYNSSDYLIESKESNLTGWAEFRYLFPDKYSIKSYWKGILVGHSVVKIIDDTIVDPLECGVYDYYVHVLDGDGESIQDANVLCIFINGTYYISAFTNASGWAEFINLPNTTYHIRTFYQGTLVSDLTDTLSSEAQTKIVNAAIYDLFIQCVDGDEKVVSGAIVHLYNSTSLIKTVATDAYGYAEFTQLPNTTYTFNVTYFGVKVGEGSLTLSSEGQMETVSLWIYDWNIKLLDGDGEALPNTKVEVYLWDGSLWGELRTTDKGFIRLLNFPSESYTFKAYWKGVKVLDVTLPLTSEEQTNNIQCAVFDLVVRVVDEEGNGLPNADVTLFWMNGTAITTTSTNSTGHTVFENMPGTTYSIKVTLEEYKDAREDITLTGEDQLIIITLQPLSKPFTSTPTGIATITCATISGITIIVIVLIKKGIIRK